jgi:hypothetical protein
MCHYGPSSATAVPNSVHAELLEQNARHRRARRYNCHSSEDSMKASGIRFQDYYLPGVRFCRGLEEILGGMKGDEVRWVATASVCGVVGAKTCLAGLRV